jgi:ribonuclease E
MTKKMLIDASHPEETRVVVADGNKVEDFDFESINKRQLAGNIYLAKVTRVEPSLQAAFVDYGGNRHGFLAFAEIHPDYYQIPMADREALLAEEEAAQRDEAEAEAEAADAKPARGRGGRARKTRVSGDAETGEGGSAKRTRSTRSGRTAKGARRGAKEAGEAPAGLEVIEVDKGESVPGPEAGGNTPAGMAIAEPDAGEAPAKDAQDETPTAPAGDTTPERAGPAPGSEAEASGADAPDGDAPGEKDDDDPSGPKSIAESTGLEEDTVTEELPREDTSGGDGDGGDGGKRANARRGRRGGRTRRQDKAEKAEPAADEAGADEADEGSGAQTVESVGADDVQEEVRRTHNRLRRRYKIQDVIKVRQILLVQVVKEERGNKGAALTTYLSLAGRYCVLMPNTARGGGISRKITNASDRKRLREVVGTLDVPKGMGLIVRTAGAERTKPEIKRDYEFLLRQWEQIRELTLKSIAPTLIYEEGSLIKRAIRDLYTKEIDGILVEGEAGYREAKDYMKMLMPSHARKVQQYADATPLFIRYQVESYLNGLFSPVVQLKSGGYIVIGITEALVAIDINSGRSTREGSVEDTALKTNLEAADEIARQLRLRDLAGLIVIDFIDMDESRNNRAVEKRLKERLKTDRARLQLGRISAFGLLEMSRQRLRPGMLEASTQPCPHCHGTGVIRSDDSLSLAILREVEEEGLKGRSAAVTVSCPVEIANYLINQKRGHLARIEGRHNLSVMVMGDPALVSPDYRIERSKTAPQPVEAATPVVTAEGAAASVEGEPPAEAAPAAAAPSVPRAEPTQAQPQESDAARSKRRRGKRGGRRRRGRGEAEMTAAEAEAGFDGGEAAPAALGETAEAALAGSGAGETGEPAGAAPATAPENDERSGAEPPTATAEAEGAATGAEPHDPEAPGAEAPPAAAAAEGIETPDGETAAHAEAMAATAEPAAADGEPAAGPPAEGAEAAEAEAEAEAEPKPKARAARKPRAPRKTKAKAGAEGDAGIAAPSGAAAEATPPAGAGEGGAEEPAKPKRKRAPAKRKTKAEKEAEAAAAAAEAETAGPEAARAADAGGGEGAGAEPTPEPQAEGPGAAAARAAPAAEAASPPEGPSEASGGGAGTAEDEAALPAEPPAPSGAGAAQGGDTSGDEGEMTESAARPRNGSADGTGPETDGEAADAGSGGERSRPRRRGWWNLSFRRGT